MKSLVYIFSILFFVPCANVVISQELRLVPYQVDRLWGYCDQNKELIIKAEYTSVEPFQEGLAIVVKDSTTDVLINNKGQKITNEYDFIQRSVYNNYFIVGKDDKYGIIDNKGKEIVPVFFESIDAYGSVFWYRSNGLWGMININGDTLVLPTYEFYIKYGYENVFNVKKNGKYGMIDTTGKVLIPVIYDEIGQGFSSGLCRVKLNDKEGFVNREGKIKIPLRYDFIWFYCDGYAVAKKDDKYGYIDTIGNTVVPFVYDFAHDLSRYKMFSVERKGKAGVVNHKNDTIVPFIYNFVKRVERFGAVVVGKIEQTPDFPIRLFGLVDTSGRELLPIEFNEISFFNDQNYAVVRKGNKSGAIDKSGMFIIPLMYDDIEIGSIKNGLALVKKDKKYGFYNFNTNKMITPFKYDYASRFEFGLAHVFLKDKMYYIDKEGVEYTE